MLFESCLLFLFLVVPDPVVRGDAVLVAVGEAAVLICNVSGTPPGTKIYYKWKNATDVVAISGLNATTYEVSSSSSVSDTGFYTCEVTVSDEGDNPLVNSATGSANIKLTVASK